MCIDIHLLSIGFPSKSLSPKGNRRISKMFNSEHTYVFLLFYLVKHCISISMLVFLTARHGLRVNFGPEACAFLARSLRRIGLKNSLWQVCYSLLTFTLVSLRGGLNAGTTWDSQWYKYKLDVECAHKLTKTSSNKQHEIPYYNFPCAKPWAGLARNLRDAGFKLPKNSPQTRKLNLNRGV